MEANAIHASPKGQRGVVGGEVFAHVGQYERVLYALQGVAQKIIVGLELPHKNL